MSAGSVAVLEPAAWPADPEIHGHLHFKPYIALNIPFDPRPMLAEALALRDRFVPHRYGKSEPADAGRWMSLALRARGGDARQTEHHAQDTTPYALTDIAALCPHTLAFLTRITDIDQCGRIRFMLLEPGAAIPVHRDYEDRLWPAGLAVNISLNMPEGCRFYADARPDGSHSKYTVQVPFADSGSVMLFNNAKYHHLVNDSALPRIHLIFHGPLRYPAASILADARAQNDLHTEAELLEAIVWKRVELGDGLAVDETLRTVLLHNRRIVGMWPDAVRLLVIDTVLVGDEALRSECLHRLTAASLYPLPHDVVDAAGVDAWLDANAGDGTSHVVIVGSGTFIQKAEDFVLGVLDTIAEMIREGAAVAGHLLDRMTQYDNLPYLHEQFVILDVDRWKACGRPRFGALYAAVAKTSFPGYRASEDQVHDDYTPRTIVADPQAVPATGLAWWGTDVIAAAIRQGGPVINVPDRLRAAKRFAYPNVAGHAELEQVRGLVRQTLAHIHQWVYCFNTEDLRMPAVPRFVPDRVISVAAGLKWIAVLRQYERRGALPEILFADYSPRAMEYVDAVLQAGTIDELVTTIAEFSRRNPSYHLSDAEVRAELQHFIASAFGGDMDAFLGFTRRIAGGHKCVTDFVLEPDRLLDCIDPARRTLVWHSNAWNSHAVLYVLAPQEIETNYVTLLRRVSERLGMHGFRRKGQHLALFGESLRDVHTVLTDGNPGTYSADERDWERLSASTILIEETRS